MKIILTAKGGHVRPAGNMNLTAVYITCPFEGTADTRWGAGTLWTGHPFCQVSNVCGLSYKFMFFHLQLVTKHKPKAHVSEKNRTGDHQSQDFGPHGGQTHGVTILSTSGWKPHNLMQSHLYQFLGTCVEILWQIPADVTEQRMYWRKRLTESADNSDVYQESLPRTYTSSGGSFPSGCLKCSLDQYFTSTTADSGVSSQTCIKCMRACRDYGDCSSSQRCLLVSVTLMWKLMWAGRCLPCCLNFSTDVLSVIQIECRLNICHGAQLLCLHWSLFQ